MKTKDLFEWREFAADEPDSWLGEVWASLQECVAKTDTSVISEILDVPAPAEVGSLRGVPYAVKDLFDVSGLPTRSSSILPPVIDSIAEGDSELVRKMSRLGASCVAKTQMNEFAYGLSGENPHYGNCPHPTLKGCLSGGSSSGSAYMVAAGHVPLAFGTDTGGSIRLPSAWCGIYGIRWKPHYCMGGVFPLAPSFDSIGWFTRSGREMAAVVEAWFASEAKPGESDYVGKCFLPGELIEADALSAMPEFLEHYGVGEPWDGGGLRELLPRCQKAFNVLQSREALGIHEDWLEAYGELYDPQVKARILRAKDWTDEDVSEADETLASTREWFAGFFESHDFLAMPICHGPSVPVSEAKPELRERTLQLTTPASLAGLPALSIPVAIGSGRSVGIQFIFKDVAPEVPLAILQRCANT